MAAKVVRLLLRPLSTLYKSAVFLRNLSYDKGWFKIHKTKAAVISVGNITTGGTGKTPLVIWLSNKLTQKGLRTAILTRGYKLKKTKLLDEPAILVGSCPEARVIIDPDRIAAAAEAQKKYGSEVLVMDDGFQHRRLHRDLDIVTIDATEPFGYGRILPSGLLREPISSIKRAHAAVITRCDLVDGAELAQLDEKLKTVNPDMIIAHAIHKPLCASRSSTRKSLSNS